jgi:hypothetical protein
MDLLERYLQAVKFWLPRAQQSDIIAELREDLRSQIEERQSGLNRDLSAEEISAIIRQCGHPMVVASRYLPQRQLIGPVLFPVYIFVLKAIALFYLLPWVLVWICLVTFVASYRSAHGVNIGSALGTLWTLILYFTAAVTVAFAVAEQMLARNQLFANWSPGKLPKVVGPEAKKRISRFDSLAGFIADLVVVTVWLNFPNGIVDLGRATSDFTITQGLHAYYVPILILMLADLALNAIMFFQPQWIWLPPALRLVTTAAFLGIVESAAKLRPFIVLKAHAAQNLDNVKAAQAFNQVVAWSFAITAVALIIALIIYAYQAVSRIRKYFADRGTPTPIISSQTM